MPTLHPVPLRRRAVRLAQGALTRSHALDRLPPAAGATVIMYHGVATAELTRYLHAYITVERFERHMAFLAAERHVVGLGELADQLAAGEEPRPGTVVITFDDGNRDNLDVAAPILARHGLPAVIYLATAYIDRGETQWADRLHIMVSTRTRHRCPLPPPAGAGPTAVTVDGSVTVDLNDEGARQAALAAWQSRLLGASYPERAEILAALTAILEPAEEAPRLTLTWDEVRELTRRHPAIELGVHTAHHVDLAAADEPTVRAELAASIEAVETATGTRPRHLSFPYGRVSPLARRLVGEAGLDTAMGGTGHQRIGPASDRLDLPRIDGGLSFTQLRARTHPAFGSLPGPLTRAL